VYPYRRIQAVLIATLALVAAGLVGCGPGETTSDPLDLVEATPTQTPRTVQVTPTRSPAGNADDAGKAREDSEDSEDSADGSQAGDAEDQAAGGDCAAYRDSGSWCVNGIGDYDCEGGSGDGPNYAPRGVEVVDPGVDPFGLDRDNDGVGCQASAPAPQPPPAPPPPGTDPRFGTCAEARANGYGPYYRGQDPEYDWYRDADGDGVVCE
jgi:hypothetical protein